MKTAFLFLFIINFLTFSAYTQVADMLDKIMPSIVTWLFMNPVMPNKSSVLVKKKQTFRLLTGKSSTYQEPFLQVPDLLFNINY